MSATAARQGREVHRAAPLQALVVMGVSGCGKSTVGAAIAEALDWRFEDADAYHPPTNVAKMAAGQPLSDEDRWPWLLALQRLLSDHAARGTPVVLACSALRPAYRRVLEGWTPQQAAALTLQQAQQEKEEEQQQQQQEQQVAPLALQGQKRAIGYVLLAPPVALLEARLQARAAQGRHFMPPQLLTSQLATLEYSEAELLLHVTSDTPKMTQPAAAAAGRDCSLGEVRVEGGEAPQSSSYSSSSSFPGAEQIATMVFQQLTA